MSSPSPLVGFIPAGRPPSGVNPTYELSPSARALAISVTTVMIVIPTIMIIIRAISKIFISKKLVAEDYLMILSWALSITFISIVYKSVQFGAGTHQWNISQQMLPSFVQYSVVAEILHSPAILFAKVSILLQIKRLFVVGKGVRFYLVQTLIWTNSMFYTIFFFITVFQCSPPARTYDRTIQGKCLSITPPLIIVGAFAVFSDIAILTLPMTWVWGMNASIRQRLGVSAIFSIALVGCATSILRLYYSVRHDESDSTYSLFGVGLAAGGEQVAAILAGNMIFIPRLCTSGWVKVISVASSLRSSRQGLFSKSRSSSTNAHHHEQDNIESFQRAKLELGGGITTNSIVTAGKSNDGQQSSVKDGFVKKERSFLIETGPSLK